MKIFQLLQNPLVKIIGVSTILYFGLFYKNDGPESLKSRLDPDRLQAELDEAKQKGQFILTNFDAKNGQVLPQKPQEKTEQISINDVILGNSHERVKCGDEVLVDYKVYDAKSRNIDQKNNITLIANGASANLIAKYIIDARNGAIREIHVPYNLETANEEIINYRKMTTTSIKYQVTIKNINRAKDVQNCSENEKK